MSESDNQFETNHSKYWGRLCVVAAALLWSTSGLFAKAPYFAGWPGPVLAFWRAAFACLILMPMVRRPQWSWKMIPMTIIFALMNYTYLESMVGGSPTNAIWLQSTAPVWVLLVGVFWLGEKAYARDWLLVLFSIVGISIILVCESQGESFGAVLYGLASGVFYAGVVLSLRLLRQYDSAWLVALNHVVTAIALSPFMVNNAQDFWPSGIQWLMLAGFGMLQMGLPYVLFARGLRSIPGHEASGIGLIEPLLVPVWVFVAWDHRPDWWTVLGGGLILVGLLVRFASEAWDRRGKRELDGNEEAA